MDISLIDGHRLTLRLLADFKVSRVTTVQVHAALNQVMPRTVEASRYDRGNGTYSMTVLVLGGTLDFVW